MPLARSRSQKSFRAAPLTDSPAKRRSNAGDNSAIISRDLSSPSRCRCAAPRRAVAAPSHRRHAVLLPRRPISQSPRKYRPMGINSRLARQRAKLGERVVARDSRARSPYFWSVHRCPGLHPRRRLAVAAGVPRRSLSLFLFFVPLPYPLATASLSSLPPPLPSFTRRRPAGPHRAPSEISLLILGCSIKSGPALSLHLAPVLLLLLRPFFLFLPFLPRAAASLRSSSPAQPLDHAYRHYRGGVIAPFHVSRERSRCFLLAPAEATINRPALDSRFRGNDSVVSSISALQLVRKHFSAASCRASARAHDGATGRGSPDNDLGNEDFVTLANSREPCRLVSGGSGE